MDTQCQILTLSSSKHQALSFCQILLKHTDSPSTSTAQGDEISVVPWKISNKYYSADVHFQIHRLSNWNYEHAQNSPALVFVWVAGEPYKKNIRLVSRNIHVDHFEVSLAVRLPRSLRHDRPEALVDGEEYQGEEEEDSQTTDEFLSSNGFEFVDVPDAPLSLETEVDDNVDDHGIPGISRVIDALSTIMWPSMVRKADTRRRQIPLDISNIDLSDDALDTVLGDDADLGSLLTTVNMTREELANARRREMEELECWLEKDATQNDSAAEKNDPWAGAAIAGDFAPDAVPQDSSVATNWMTSVGGFDDDFTVFVSAAAAPEPFAGPSTLSQPKIFVESPNFSPTFPFNVRSESVPSTPILDVHAAGPEAGKLSLAYHTLGSVSDFGADDHDAHWRRMESDDGENEDEEHGDDDGLPTQAEIIATSQRIFGESLPIQNMEADEPAHPLSSSTSDPQFRSPVEATSHSPWNQRSSISDSQLESMDLSHVLSALQNMKEEISSMSDMTERRRAAAKVALGLVYGLEGNIE